jgi:uncharacterized membrane protein YphA (DoxX/SURF4 family)
MLVALGNKLQDVNDAVRGVLDFLGPMALRLYLAPVFWIAGNNKLAHMDSTIQWFGNTDWGLGLPAPALLAWMAVLTEVGGSVMLVSGLGIRWITIPLMVTMLVAIFSVHLENGWQAVADLQSPWAGANASEALDRLRIAKGILREHGNYDWLTEHGNFVVSNNGIEWAVTYFIMLMALLFLGGGKFTSIDFWLGRRFREQS